MKYRVQGDIIIPFVIDVDTTDAEAAEKFAREMLEADIQAGMQKGLMDLRGLLTPDIYRQPSIDMCKPVRRG